MTEFAIHFTLTYTLCLKGIIGLRKSSCSIHKNDIETSVLASSLLHSPFLIIIRTSRSWIIRKFSNNADDIWIFGYLRKRTPNRERIFKICIKRFRYWFYFVFLKSCLVCDSVCEMRNSDRLNFCVNKKGWLNRLMLLLPLSSSSFIDNTNAFIIMRHFCMCMQTFASVSFGVCVFDRLFSWNSIFGFFHVQPLTQISHPHTYTRPDTVLRSQHCSCAKQVNFHSFRLVQFTKCFANNRKCGTRTADLAI